MVSITQKDGTKIVYSVNPKRETIDMALKDICKSCDLEVGKRKGYANTDDMYKCVNCRSDGIKNAAKGEVFEITVTTPDLRVDLKKLAQNEDIPKKAPSIHSYAEKIKDLGLGLKCLVDADDLL